MSKYKKLSAEQHSEICSLYIDGLNTVELGQRFSVSPQWIGDLLRRRGVVKRSRSSANSRYDVNHSFFDIIDTEESAYWLGFLMADGYIRKNANIVELKISRKDEEHLRTFKETLESTHPIKYSDATIKHADKTKTYPMCSIYIGSPQIVSALAMYGVVPNKTTTLDWPEGINHKFVQHLIRGLVDGDGSFGSYKANSGTSVQLKFSLLGTELLISHIQNILMDECDLRRVRLHSASNTSPQVVAMTYGGNHQVRRIANYLYKDSTVFLERKRRIALEV